MAVEWTQRTFCWLLRTDVVREDDEDEEEEEEEEDPEARLFVDAQHDAEAPGRVAASCQLLRWDGSVSWDIYARDDETARWLFRIRVYGSIVPLCCFASLNFRLNLLNTSSLLGRARPRGRHQQNIRTSSPSPPLSCVISQRSTTLARVIRSLGGRVPA